uniref:Uncharacterized protein n=1 Tax=Ascaris lumbricoides TaxID=6252 RepID=A0A9J2PEK3_ASCLU
MTNDENAQYAFSSLRVLCTSNNFAVSPCKSASHECLFSIYTSEPLPRMMRLCCRPIGRFKTPVLNGTENKKWYHWQPGTCHYHTLLTYEQPCCKIRCYTFALPIKFPTTMSAISSTTDTCGTKQTARAARAMDDAFFGWHFRDIKINTVVDRSLGRKTLHPLAALEPAYRLVNIEGMQAFINPDQKLNMGTTCRAASAEILAICRTRLLLLFTADRLPIKPLDIEISDHRAPTKS